MELSIFEIINILLKRVRILVLSTIVGLSGVFIITLFLIAPTYTSTSQLYVSLNQTLMERQSNYSELLYAQKIVDSYLIILSNDDFLKSVAEHSGLKYTPVQIRKMLTLSSINNTEIFEVTVNAKSPQESFKLVETITALAPDKIMRINESYIVKLVSTATLPSSPSAPNLFLNSVAGAILGFTISAIAIVLIEILDTRVKSEEDLIAHHSVVVLGSIPKFDKDEQFILYNNYT